MFRIFSDTLQQYFNSASEKVTLRFPSDNIHWYQNYFDAKIQYEPKHSLTSRNLLYFDSLETKKGKTKNEMPVNLLHVVSFTHTLIRQIDKQVTSHVNRYYP